MLGTSKTIELSTKVRERIRTIPPFIVDRLAPASKMTVVDQPEAGRQRRTIWHHHRVT